MLPLPMLALTETDTYLWVILPDWKGVRQGRRGELIPCPMVTGSICQYCVRKSLVVFIDFIRNIPKPDMY